VRSSMSLLDPSRSPRIGAGGERLPAAPCRPLPAVGSFEETFKDDDLP
jgi:hypothetical protein